MDSPLSFVTAEDRKAKLTAKLDERREQVAGTRNISDRLPVGSRVPFMWKFEDAETYEELTGVIDGWEETGYGLVAAVTTRDGRRLRLHAERVQAGVRKKK